MLSLEKKTQGTTSVVKYLWKCLDGALIESVYIPEGKRRTFCVSSQVGCTLGCAICATGRMGWKRNLHPGEITDQVVQMIRSLGLRPTNLVLMGMGEPLLNYKHVIKALHILNDPDGTAIGHRKITISTAGIVPVLKTYIKEKQPFKLAVSLNATTDRQRSVIMPVNRKYPLHELLRTIRTYTEVSKKRVTFEYVLIRDFNDTPEDAERLKKLIKSIPCKINLIACNPVDKRFERPDEARIESFAEILRSLNAPVTLRLSKGNEIKGACGQLAVRSG
jgi:23S rRNA (adenine2503-C2)-methyltransferase